MLRAQSNATISSISKNMQAVITILLQLKSRHVFQEWPSIILLQLKSRHATVILRDVKHLPVSYNVGGVIRLSSVDKEGTISMFFS